MASNKAKFFGFRLQAAVTAEQVVDHWLLAPAGRNNGKILAALFDEGQGLIVFDDNACYDPGQYDLL